VTSISEIRYIWRLLISATHAILKLIRSAFPPIESAMSYQGIALFYAPRCIFFYTV
jgi:hypothetical protein